MVCLSRQHVFKIFKGSLSCTKFTWILCPTLQYFVSFYPYATFLYPLKKTEKYHVEQTGWYETKNSLYDRSNLFQLIKVLLSIH